MPFFHGGLELDLLRCFDGFLCQPILQPAHRIGSLNLFIACSRVRVPLPSVDFDSSQIVVATRVCSHALVRCHAYLPVCSRIQEFFWCSSLLDGLPETQRIHSAKRITIVRAQPYLSRVVSAESAWE